MKFKLQPYNLQELGQRDNQEDSMFPCVGCSTSDDRLFILCDGMGGHEKGEVASATVCETISRYVLDRWNPNSPLSDDLLQEAIDAAYDALDAKDNGEAKKMGTTMTFVCFHADGVTVAHIGDSRVYQLRPATKSEQARIVWRTRDHSLVEDLVKIGEITEDEAKNHPQKNVITRAMQPCLEHRHKADIKHLTDVKEGDYFYMCSDGMLEQSTDENILNIITKQNATNEQKVEMLRNVTEENRDNHTAHLVKVEKVEGMPVIHEACAGRTYSTQSSVAPQGTWVSPEFTKAKQKKKPIHLIVATVFVVIIAIVASIFLFVNKKENIEPTQSSVKTEVKAERMDMVAPATIAIQKMDDVKVSNEEGAEDEVSKLQSSGDAEKASDSKTEAKVDSTQRKKISEVTQRFLKHGNTSSNVNRLNGCMGK